MPEDLMKRIVKMGSFISIQCCNSLPENLFISQFSLTNGECKNKELKLNKNHH